MMTTESFFNSITRWKDMLIIGAMLSGVVSICLSIIFYGVMSIWGQNIRVTAQDWLGITSIAQSIDILSGNHRVTTQPDGMSYVRDSVYPGDVIELVLYIGRTDYGESCILRELIPLYVDDVGETHAGERRQPAEQLGPEVSRREIHLELPEDILAGHAFVTLQLEYVCNGATVFETIRPVPFTVLETASGGR